MCNRYYNPVSILSFGQELPEPDAEPDLSFPVNLLDLARQPLLTIAKHSADPGRKAICLCRFGQSAAGMSVAGFGDSATLVV